MTLGGNIAVNYLLESPMDSVSYGTGSILLFPIRSEGGVLTVYELNLKRVSTTTEKFGLTENVAGSVG